MNFIAKACTICQGNLYFRFSKYSDANEKTYNIYDCNHCKNWQIYPIPDSEEVRKLYEENYFAKRTNRGYDDYAGEKVKQSVLSTLQKNLADLDFYSWEDKLAGKYSLEIGAAAGHCVEYLQTRGWNAMGIDISKSMTEAGIKRGLNILNADFLTYDFNKTNTGIQFDLITLWATLEHLPQPDQYIKKISQMLKPEGHLFLTTTNTGFWARIYGNRWRYLNVPEHIYYFNKKSLSQLFKKYNLELNKAFTYGSGFTSRKNATLFFKFMKYIADRAAKYFLSGDMIVLDIVHNKSIILNK